MRRVFAVLLFSALVGITGTGPVLAGGRAEAMKEMMEERMEQKKEMMEKKMDMMKKMMKVKKKRMEAMKDMMD